MNVFRAVGSALRGTFSQATVAPDDALRASIEKLMQVSDTIIRQDKDARASALDDIGDAR